MVHVYLLIIYVDFVHVGRQLEASIHINHIRHTETKKRRALFISIEIKGKLKWGERGGKRERLVSKSEKHPPLLATHN